MLTSILFKWSITKKLNLQNHSNTTVDMFKNHRNFSSMSFLSEVYYKKKHHKQFLCNYVPKVPFLSFKNNR